MGCVHPETGYVYAPGEVACVYGFKCECAPNGGWQHSNVPCDGKEAAGMPPPPRLEGEEQ